MQFDGLSENTRQAPKPFLYWAGGKRQLLTSIKNYIPKDITTYYEPFLGGGSVLFDLMPQKFVVSDVNSEIINTYNIIKTHADLLINRLKSLRNNPQFFYRMRDLDRKQNFNHLSAIERAARTIYLNKTCFNGLFRVNRQGQFNAPFGHRKSPDIVNAETLRSIQRYLIVAEGKILNLDFAEAVASPAKGSFVYMDPPYDPISPTSSFTGYTKQGFDRREQARLKAFCDKLTYQGCRFLLSNSATPFIRTSYKDYKTETVKARRSINATATARGPVDEVLIRNFQ